MKALTNNTIIKVSEHFDTPTFLYNLDVIRKKYIQLRNLLMKSASIFYSIKANPALAICQFLKTLGSGCEVSSQNELLIALKAGFLPERIIFVGPGKKREELEYCIRYKIKHIVCESIEEIDCINSISEKYKTKTSILIRINPDFSVTNAPIKMSGVASQFGIEVKSLIEHLKTIKKFAFISLDGIQVYNASRVLDKEAICSNIANILNLARSLSEQFSFRLKTIDVGGGFGIAYFQNENPINENELISGINFLFSEYQKIYPETQFIVELGRYLVSESGYLISKIQSIKKSHEKNYIVVDAGMHCYFATTGLGSFVHRNFPMRHISLVESDHIKMQKKNIYQVAGPLCTPGDVLLKDIELSNPQLGDLIVVLNAGAYGLSASPGKFLSHGFPAEVICDQEKVQCIRRRENIEDIVSTQFYLS